jgi:hypothetical protein
LPLGTAVKHTLIYIYICIYYSNGKLVMLHP